MLTATWAQSHLLPVAQCVEKKVTDVSQALMMRPEARRGDSKSWNSNLVGEGWIP